MTPHAGGQLLTLGPILLVTLASSGPANFLETDQTSQMELGTLFPANIDLPSYSSILDVGWFFSRRVFPKLTS